ncbi:MAG: serine/threonine-protein kinase [Gammaproteobacteria bacterium]
MASPTDQRPERTLVLHRPGSPDTSADTPEPTVRLATPRHDGKAASSSRDAGVLDPERFRIEDELGSGGMGRVLRARDRQLRRFVAVKLLHTPDDDEGLRGDWLETLRFEAQVMARIQHPGIVQVFELVERRGVLGLVMEYVQGQTLHQWLSEHDTAQDPAARATALRLLLQVADAVGHAHGRGIVHRDIKGANVMIGNDGRCRVMDFGIAAAGGRRATRDGIVAGSPAYMAPELLDPDDGPDDRPNARTDARLDARVDVYALGVLMYLILNGSLPYRGDTPIQTLALARSGDARAPLRGRRRRGPEADANAVCMKAMARDPEARYDNATAFAADLRALLDADPVDARGYGALEKIQRGAVRGWRTLVGAAVISATLLFSLNFAADALHVTAEEALIEELQDKLGNLAYVMARLVDLEGPGVLDDGSGHGLEAALRRFNPEVQRIEVLEPGAETTLPLTAQAAFFRALSGEVGIYRHGSDPDDPESGLTLTAFAPVQRARTAAVVAVHVTSEFVAHRFDEIEAEYKAVEALATLLALLVLGSALTLTTRGWYGARVRALP